MKKYLFTGIVTFAFIFTTVYALNDNDNSTINDTPTTHHNCPYFDETTGTHNHSNNKNRNCLNNHNGNGHARQGGCHRHNR